MTDFSTVEDTLFLPVLGRIYASGYFPQILYEEKALELRGKLPKTIKGQNTQIQYTLLVTVSGLVYHFEQDHVLGLFRMLQNTEMWRSA